MNYTRAYYYLKPLIPRKVQIFLRRTMVRRNMARHSHVWPIDHQAATLPQAWKGWPENKKFALVLTHDVDTAKGQERCRQLAELEDGLGFRSSFNFVPRRYQVQPEIRTYLVGNGFEVGVHGLYHDGKYYDTREIFRERARQINQYLKEWGAVGFRTPSMLHNLEWIHDLDISYDASTFDTDPYEPQADGVRTIFPFWVEAQERDGGYVELPYTLAQDFTLFVLMEEKTIDIWKKKTDWVAEKGGMVLINTHPDYMNFGNTRIGLEEYPAEYYAEFLRYIKSRYEGLFWPALAKDVAAFWKNNYSHGR